MSLEGKQIYNLEQQVRRNVQFDWFKKNGIYIDRIDGVQKIEINAVEKIFDQFRFTGFKVRASETLAKRKKRGNDRMYVWTLFTDENAVIVSYSHN